MSATIPPGKTLITYAQARKQLGDEGKSAFHARLKRDPTFPRPVYLSEREPRIIASELDSWISGLAAKRNLPQEADHAPA